MAYSQIPFYKYPLIVYLLFLCCPVISSSCNSVHTDKKIVHKDSSTVLQLPAPGIITASEALRIKTACQLWFDTVLKQRGFNGGILVAKDGNIIFEQYNGTGHLPGSDTITQNTSLHIASISKTFTAMAVLKLWQDGKLQIDDTFSKYFPQFNYPGITIRNLLSHRSGLPNYNYFMEKLGWDESQYAGNEDILNYLITKKDSLTDILPPNTRFSYCNTNFALLALLIEKVSGLTYASYLANTFFKPLQMEHTYIFNLADTLKAVPSYNWRGNPETFNFLDKVYGDKNIYTTPRDLLIWDRALSSNIIFTKETLEQAYAPYSNEKPGIRNYGLGWRMNIFQDGNRIIYHNGWWHGSNATFIRLLKEKATIIVIGNKFTRAVYHAKILCSLFGNYYLPVDDEEPVTVKDTAFVMNQIIKSDTAEKIRLKKEKSDPR